MPPDKKGQAKALFLQGVSISEIERRGVASRRTIQRWMKTDAEEGNDWEALRDSLPQPQPPERPKIVSFERPRTPEFRSEPPVASRPRPDIDGDLDLLKVVEGAIADGATLLTTASDTNDTKGFGGVAGGLCRLIELRLKLKPMDEATLIEQLLERGLSPRELVARLKEAGWSRPA